MVVALLCASAGFVGVVACAIICGVAVVLSDCGVLLLSGLLLGVAVVSGVALGVAVVLLAPLL